MRPRWIALALALAGCGGGGGDGRDGAGPDAAADATPIDPSAEIFDPAAVPRFEIDLPVASVDALVNDPLTYVRATLHYNGEVVADIGLRLKGEYNFRPLGQKSAFKLKFDEFVSGQRFHGLKRLTLNNALEDQSWVAERLAYTVFRAGGLAAPRANLAWVVVNGEDYGLYINIETEDKNLLARWFADPDGNLYEEMAADLFPGNENQFELETNETANDRSDLTALFAAIDGADDATLLADVGGVIDTGAFLDFCAAEAASWQWDGYCYTRFGPNNFRLYHEPGVDKFYFLPWGMDMSWKSYESSLDVFDARGMLLQRCVNSAACREQYRGALAATADRLEALDVVGLVDAWGAQARPLVAADPKKETDDAGFEAALADVRDQAVARPADIRAQIAP
jgi:spore coat protein CotH